MSSTHIINQSMPLTFMLNAAPKYRKNGGRLACYAMVNRDVAAGYFPFFSTLLHRPRWRTFERADNQVSEKSDGEADTITAEDGRRLEERENRGAANGSNDGGSIAQCATLLPA